MAAEWRESTWGDEVALEYGKALRGHDQSTGEYRVFGSNGPIGWTSEPLAAGPGVILGRKGAYRGIEYSPDPFFVIDTAYYVVSKQRHDMRWLYYAIKHHKLGEIDDGSPIPSTTRAAVYPREVEIPPLSEQRAIAHILGTLDDKIELNRRTSVTLETMARALFKSWFVDFDPVRAKTEGRDPGVPGPIADLFPDRLVIWEELGAIPEGWRVNSIGQICRRVAMGPFGSDIKTDNFIEFGVPVVRGSNLTAGFVEDSFVFVSEAKADELSNANAFPGDIIITHRGTLGQVGLISDRSLFPRYVVSQSQMLLSVDRAVASPHFVYEFLRSDAGQHALLANTSQTGVPAIARPTSSARAIRIVVPPSNLLAHFTRVVSSLYARRDHSMKESRSLTALRDALLPRLISGELRVKDAETFLDRVL